MRLFLRIANALIQWTTIILFFYALVKNKWWLLIGMLAVFFCWLGSKLESDIKKLD